MPRHDAINLEAKSRLVMIRFLKKVFIDKQVYYPFYRESSNKIDTGKKGELYYW